MRIKAKVIKPHRKGAHHQPFAANAVQCDAVGGGDDSDQIGHFGGVNARCRRAQFCGSV